MACVLQYTLLEIHIKWRFHRNVTARILCICQSNLNIYQHFQSQPAQTSQTNLLRGNWFRHNSGCRQAVIQGCMNMNLLLHTFIFCMIHECKNMNIYKNWNSFCIHSYSWWPESRVETSCHVIKFFVKLVVIENLGRCYDCYTSGNVSYKGGGGHNNFEILYLQFCPLNNWIMRLNIQNFILDAWRDETNQRDA